MEDLPVAVMSYSVTVSVTVSLSSNIVSYALFELSRKKYILNS